MRRRIPKWVLLLFGGSLLFAGEFSGCLADILRDSSDYLGDTANKLDGKQNIDDVIADIESWFD